MIEILPAILEKTFDAVQEKCDRLKGKSEQIQLDIADGVFVPGKTWQESKDIAAIPRQFKLDMHLMVDRPEQTLSKWNYSSIFRISFHYEAALDIRRTIQLIRQMNKEVGIALNLNTPVSVLYDILEDIDLALLLAVVPGTQGQEFNPLVLDKIQELRAHSPNIKIGVDGGVSLLSAPGIIAAGANLLVCGSWLWAQDDLSEAIKLLQQKNQ